MESNEPAVCPICYESLACPEIRLKCKHAFHRQCIMQWVMHSNTCPVCRMSMLAVEPRNEIEPPCSKLLVMLSFVSTWGRYSIAVCFLGIVIWFVRAMNH